MWQDEDGNWYVTDKEVHEIQKNIDGINSKIRTIKEILGKYEGLDEQNVIDLITEIRAELIKEA